MINWDDLMKYYSCLTYDGQTARVVEVIIMDDTIRVGMEGIGEENIVVICYSLN